VPVQYQLPIGSRRCRATQPGPGCRGEWSGLVCFRWWENGCTCLTLPYGASLPACPPNFPCGRWCPRRLLKVNHGLTRIPESAGVDASQPGRRRAGRRDSDRMWPCEPRPLVQLASQRFPGLPICAFSGGSDLFPAGCGRRSDDRGRSQLPMPFYLLARFGADEVLSLTRRTRRLLSAVLAFVQRSPHPCPCDQQGAAGDRCWRRPGAQGPESQNAEGERASPRPFQPPAPLG